MNEIKKFERDPNDPWYPAADKAAEIMKTLGYTHEDTTYQQTHEAIIDVLLPKRPTTAVARLEEYCKLTEFNSLEQDKFIADIREVIAALATEKARGDRAPSGGAGKVVLR